MSLIRRIIRSSIGKKYIMAVSGACLSLFLLTHLAGNSAIFWGKDVYNAYAAHLHSLGILIYILEVLLALVFFVHILVAVMLYFENLGARPNRYEVKKNGANNWNSRTMPYTGLIIFIFVLVHLVNFHFGERTVTTAEMVREVLSRPGYAAFYLFSLAALALHVSHGFWSMFQSMGLNHPKYNNFLRYGGLVTALVIGAVYMLIPMLVTLNDKFLR